MRCVVFGVGGRYIYEVVEILGRLRWEVEAYVVNRPDTEPPAELNPIVDVSSLPEGLTRCPVVVPLGTPAHRAVAIKEAGELGFDEFPAVVDPTAIVASSATMGEGALINAGVILAARSVLASHVSINRGVSVGHDAVVSEYVFLGPGAILCGGVAVGRGAFVGAGAVVNPDIVIGENAIVGSGSVVTRPVPDHTLVVGNPAKVVKESVPGAGGASV